MLVAEGLVSYVAPLTRTQSDPDRRYAYGTDPCVQFSRVRQGIADRAMSFWVDLVET